MLGGLREPRPGGEPRAGARARHRDARAGRPRQAHVRHRPRRSRSFGAWLEQLIAESTGKQRGRASCRWIASRSAPCRPTAPDRVFVRVVLDGSAGRRSAEGLRRTRLVDGASPRRATRSSGSRSTTRSTSAASSSAGRSPRPIAGTVLGIDPFDQPNVEEAEGEHPPLLAPSDETERQPFLGGRPARAGRGPRRSTATRRCGSPPATARSSRRAPPPPRAIRPTSYLALQAFIAPTDARSERLAPIRPLLRDRTGRATTAATARASSIPPASCTRAARRSGGSSS